MSKFAWTEEDGKGLKYEPPAPPELAALREKIAKIDRVLQEAGGLVEDGTSSSLYVSRPVLNGAEIYRWAKENGIKGRVPAAELHITICYSRKPLDWMQVGEPWDSELTIAAGGPRRLECFKDSLVIELSARSLKYRHQEIIEAGGSHDFGEYRPHLTIAQGYEKAPAGVTPFLGAIKLGPEIFEEVKDDAAG